MLSVLTRLNSAKILKTFAVIDMLYWFIACCSGQVVWNNLKRNPAVLNDIRAKTGKSDAEADAEYRKKLAAWEQAADWVTVLTAFMVFVQIILIVGIVYKNRCLIFTWICLCCIIVTNEIIVISSMPVPSYTKYFSALWILRFVFIYLSAQYMLQITSERLGAEEVAPPEFRPQTDDPREFREGLNYPSYPRSLEFSARVSALSRLEHSHPKRWVPTYDAIDSDGRMVTVVDDPVFENL